MRTISTVCPTTGNSGEFCSELTPVALITRFEPYCRRRFLPVFRMDDHETVLSCPVPALTTAYVVSEPL